MKLTLEQFKEKYGELGIKFSIYYKHTFVFTGEVENKHFNISVGGNGDDIYNLFIDVTKTYQIKDFDISYAVIMEEGKVIDELQY